MTKLLVSAFALSLSIAAPALAQTAPSTDPAQAKAGTYKVEPMHTRLLFGVSHLGFSTYYGSFTKLSGSLTLDPAAPEKSVVEVHVPIADVFVDAEHLSNSLKSDKWLDAAKFSEAVFKSTKITLSGKGKATIQGDLTLHGVTKPVTLDAKFNAAGENPLNKAYTVGFDATAKIKRSEFGVTTYVPVIGDDVDLIISAAFERQN